MLYRLAELPLLVVLLGATALFCWLPATHALVLRDHATARAFFYSGAILLVVTVMLALATSAYSPRNAARSHLMALAGAYLTLPIAMALPVLQAVPDTTLVNAWFEMLSSFTTTGASVYSPERLAPSVHLWRATVGWFGGFYILLAAYGVLAPLNLGGAEVISGRVPGRGATGATQITRIAEPAQRLTRYAMVIFPVYTALTFLLWVSLLIAGEDGLLAMAHAMGTLSTSGISAGEGLRSSTSGLAGEVLIFAFLIFAVTRRAFPASRLADKYTSLKDDPELRLAAVIVLVLPFLFLATHFLVGSTLHHDTPLSDTLRELWGVIFTSASFLTTTGYVSSYWTTIMSWSGLGTPGLLLMGLCIIGGGVATTAGGVKLLRVYALFRHGERELDKIIHPNSVGGRGSDARRLRREGAYMAWIFFMLFAISIFIISFALALTGIEFEPAMVLTISALTTTGPLADVVTTSPVSFGAQSDVAKLILGAAMVVGRLETLALIALLSPADWRR